MVSWKSESRKWTPPKANGASWLFVVLSIALFMLLKCSVIDAGAQAEPIEPTPVCFWIDEGLVCINHIAMTPQPTPMPTLTPTPTITPLPNIVNLPLIYR